MFITLFVIKNIHNKNTAIYKYILTCILHVNFICIFLTCIFFDKPEM